MGLFKLKLAPTHGRAARYLYKLYQAANVLFRLVVHARIGRVHHLNEVYLIGVDVSNICCDLYDNNPE